MDEAQGLRISIPFDCTDAERAQASTILSGRTAQPLARGKADGLFGWVLFIGLAVVLFSIMHKGEAAKGRGQRTGGQTPQVTSAAEVLFFAGVGCVVAGFTVMRFANRKLARRWKSQITLSFDRSGITEKRPGRTDIYHWTRFSGLEEGPDVFVLRTSPKRGITIPKRLFRSAEDRNRFSSLALQCTMRPAVPVALGFPVQPL